MHILALDTTSRGGSVAVVRDGVLLHEHAGDPTVTHGERLPRDIAQSLEHAAIRVDDLDLLAVASGPGSFTGLRVGIAAVQGLALARGLRVVSVPTLEALARAVARSVLTPDVADQAGGLVASWMDGQRGEVFAAAYRVLQAEPWLPAESGSHRGARGTDGGAGGSDRGARERDTGAGDSAAVGSHAVGLIEEIRPPKADKPEAIVDGWALPPEGPPILFVGDGAVRYRGVIAERIGARARVLEPPLLAATIARIAFQESYRAVEPHAIIPIYVRRPDAELARERRQGPA